MFRGRVSLQSNQRPQRQLHHHQPRRTRRFALRNRYARQSHHGQLRQSALSDINHANLENKQRRRLGHHAHLSEFFLYNNQHQYEFSKLNGDWSAQWNIAESSRKDNFCQQRFNKILSLAAGNRGHQLNRGKPKLRCRRDASGVQNTGKLREAVANNQPSRKTKRSQITGKGELEK